MLLEDLQLPRKLSELFQATLELTQEDVYHEHEQISRYFALQYKEF